MIHNDMKSTYMLVDWTGLYLAWFSYLLITSSIFMVLCIFFLKTILLLSLLYLLPTAATELILVELVLDLVD